MRSGEPDELPPITTQLLLAMSRRHLTAKDIAPATGKSPQEIVRILTGEHKPLSETAERIRLAIGADPEEIYRKVEVS